jgi:hypothetical protein
LVAAVVKLAKLASYKIKLVVVLPS